MLDVRDLYQEVILDHNRSPRHHHAMEDATTFADGFNRLCGDKIRIFLKIKNNIIESVSFTGCGCAISTASASLMTDALVGKTSEQAHALFEYFHQMLTEDNRAAASHLGKLAVLEGVKAYPARVKCATLAWQTLQAALGDSTEVVSTE